MLTTRTPGPAKLPLVPVSLRLTQQSVSVPIARAADTRAASVRETSPPAPDQDVSVGDISVGDISVGDVSVSVSDVSVSVNDGNIGDVSSTTDTNAAPLDTTTMSDVAIADYDALVLPGGVANPDALRADETAVAFVRDFVDSGKPVAAI